MLSKSKYIEASDELLQQVFFCPEYNYTRPDGNQ